MALSTFVIGFVVLGACSDSSAPVTSEKSGSSEKTASTITKKQTSSQLKVDQDIKQFRSFFSVKFPNIDLKEFKDGVYAIDAAAREQWLEIEDFPPYEIAIDEGLEFFEIPFANGKSYADCFENNGEAVRQNYPYFNSESNQVITLELAINQCREKNGEKPLDYGQGELAAISAYMANSSRNKIFDIKVPNQMAYEAYMNGKQFFYSKRGQLNFSCADCHLKFAGSLLRADRLSPAIGHPTSMPVYRSSWGYLGTLNHRFRECNRNVRAQPLAFQSEAYRNLEYYLTLMSNGLVVNGPSSRK